MTCEHGKKDPYMTCEHGKKDPLECLGCAIKFGITKALLEFGLMAIITIVVGVTIIHFGDDITNLFHEFFGE